MTDNKTAAVSVKKNSREPEIGCVPRKFWFGFFGSHFLVPIICALTHIRVRPDKEFVKHEGPIIVLANHESYLDPMVINRLTKARPANFVTGEFVFRARGWGYLFKLGGAIPKKQFVVDTVAVKAMMRVMKRKGVLIIFPEATRHVDGKSIEFDDGVAKLAKKSGASVYIAHIHGAYMSWPRWSVSGMRKGRITAEFVRKIYAPEVESMSVDELQQQILAGIDYNENEWIRENPRKYRSSRPAAGLQNIAYACPRCNREFTMRYMNSGKHDMIQCNNCGNAARILPTGLLAPVDPNCFVYDDLHKWAQWERAAISEEIRSENFRMELDADLFKVFDAFTFAKTGSGKVTITGKEIIYEGTECEAGDGIPYKKGRPLAGYRNVDLGSVCRPVKVVFEIDTMRGLVASYGKYFEIYDRAGQLYRFYVDGQKVFKVHEIVALLGRK
ncbi:MAG: 1-acyl-sn-glycerol-3-phosphate acyltransferase [Saccharofermentans sp.]|jgi:1-acyl-sn-glycerol-3-phosphate acyltransferase|nr:1-acyl-sn-glycerol-3-phosphate acyltransferase [Mageeibacillus sp.]MCI1264318.1 1-acyl-sn-glycerol-3-phosphate acyltransferase [Saccharofermentans sp.]MCI1275031.1 1-acyl-sn-glycerol-3-phosphate acyltransferase [Saccharofermentans sp.]